MTISGLDFAYGGQTVFADFHLKTNSSRIGLSGPPGCGKSTLLKILARFLPPDRVTTFDVPSKAVLVLQEDALLPWLTGWQNLELVGIKSKAKVNQHKLYPLVYKLLPKRAHAMSFGQRRTIELFRALMFEPAFVCLDEPFNFIDERTRLGFLEYLLGDLGCTFIMSTHHVDELSRLDASILRFSGTLPVSGLEVV